MAEQSTSTQDEPKTGTTTTSPALPQQVTVVSVTPPPVIATKGLDVAPHGGRYEVGGQIVDANGNVVKKGAE